MDVRHVTRHSYPGGAGRVALVMRLWPEPFAGLTVRNWEVTVANQTIKSTARTGYGERAGLWSGRVPGGDLEIVAQGTVEVENRAGVVAGLTSRVDPRLFLRSTRRTAPDKAIRAFSAALGNSADTLPWLHALMAQVHEQMAYRSGSTDRHTSAAEAFAAGRGVCQDHAHVFLAAARSAGIPARYVCGYLLAGQGEAALHETHAWIEAYVEQLGWVGFDPSANICPTERYVRLCVGLDAADAAPIRGVETAGSADGFSADVIISPANSSRTDAPRRPQARRAGMQQQ